MEFSKVYVKNNKIKVVPKVWLRKSMQNKKRHWSKELNHAEIVYTLHNDFTAGQ